MTEYEYRKQKLEAKIKRYKKLKRIAFWSTIISIVIGLLFILVAVSLSEGSSISVLSIILFMIGILIIVIDFIISAIISYSDETYGHKARAYLIQLEKEKDKNEQ